MVKEVNEIRAERIAKNANPLALVAAAQSYPGPYYQAPKSHKSYAPTSKASPPTRFHATTRHKGKEKNLALISKYFKKLYKPTNNNLRTSSNSRNKNVDTTLRYKNDNQTGQFRNQRTVNVAGDRETVGSQVVQQTGIQCFNCKEFAKKGVQLQAEQSDWLADTDKDIDEQELEAHYSFMAKIQEVHTADSGTDTEPLEQVDSNVIPDLPDMYDNDIQTDQNAVECDDERVALANLIANLKLDVNENKKIQTQIKKLNTSLAHELTKCKSILSETSRTLGESNSIRDSCLVALQNKQTEFERYKTLNDRTVDYEKLEHKLNETLGLLAQKDIDIKEGLKLKAYEISVVKEKHDELVKQSLLTKSHYEGLVKEKTKIVQLILFIVDSRCTKYMTGNLTLLCNFVKKYLGTVRFGNDQFAPILGYRDLVQGNIMINRVYYVEGLNHNLFLVGQICDANLEVAFRKSTCFVRDLQGNDLLAGNRGFDLYTILLQETTSSTPICLMAKASPTQAWLWHRRLSHLNFDYIILLSKKDVVIGLPKLKYVKDQLYSSCEVSKAKRSSFKTKAVPSSKGRLNLLHMDMCGPMWVASINGKKYILLIVDDYSRYTWTLFLRSKDETPEVLKDFLIMIQRNL
ncbi:retrovirus-related pol polyprotein from transposon TNT 1-94 [Tanacetum coccineum]